MLIIAEISASSIETKQNTHSYDHNDEYLTSSADVNEEGPLLSAHKARQTARTALHKGRSSTARTS